MAIKIQSVTVIDDSQNGTLTGTLAVTGQLTLNGTGAIKLPVGTELERPTPAAGMLRFNNESVSFEGYNGTVWGAIGGGGGGAGTDEFARTIALAAL